MSGTVEPRPHVAAEAAAALPQGPMSIVMTAGSGAADKDAARQAIEAVLHDAGREFEIAPLCDPVTRLCDDVARRTAARGGLLVAAGGDGTVSCCADAARRHDVPLGIVPLGTFNYF